ncbi:hypothetical protein BRC79_09870 [Halobacteriales archaeon QH_8_67_27]|jgi:hypothetical protein|nr:MAG: hypothetical protein BRC79_09870 [Halobacteriales archaeon QH_8_67_27]
MVDPTSDLNEDVSADEAPTCAVCGDALVENPDHRVVTRVDDGEVVTTHFCSDAHRDEWSG